ncbi:MAG: FG-GAP-like repeat-containing protein, partial [Chitinophagaceae bacterium]|nr:FG-GAP-like repeat-containing protein [Chitinophagaceae bacterium]
MEGINSQALNGPGKGMNIWQQAGKRLLVRPFRWWSLLMAMAWTAVQAQPIITSFTPQSGPVGTAITIQGSGFSTVPSQNKVLVGGIAAPVLAATTSSLTVQAPAGTEWRQITVSVNGLTGYSRQPFVVTYPADYSRLDRSQYDADADLPVKGQTSCLATGDLDGDGRPELVMGIPARSGLLIHRNTSAQGDIQLQDTVFFSTHAGIGQVISADLNGDGWLDLASSHESERRISILINKGNGSIDFEPPVIITATDRPLYLAAADLNTDGRTDLVASSYSDRQVVVYRNQGSGSGLSYAVGGVLFTGGDCHQLSLQDVDGDGRTDVVVAQRFQNGIAVFRNTSQAGGLSFAPPVQAATGRSPRSLKLGDLDKDGKPDLLVAHSDDQNLVVMVNSSVPGSVSFLPPRNIYSAYDLMEVEIADVNGNGDLEAMVNSYSQRSIYCFRFTGSGSNLQAERFFAFRPGSLASDSIWRASQQYGFTDLDADGKTDLYSMSDQKLITTLVRNRINEPLILGFSPHYGGAGTRVTVKGARLQQVQSMQVGGRAPQSFQAINDSTIEMVVAGGNTGAVTAHAATGRGVLATFSFRAVIDSFAPLSGKPGQTITIYGKSFDNDPAKNLVTFGPVKAVVTAAQPTQLQVVVPPGAISGRIGVTAGGLTARSPQPFYVTSGLQANRFHAYSFEDTVTAQASRGDFTTRIRVADFNRDGRPDWISDGYESSLYLTFSVARNMSQPGKIAWAPIQTFTAYDASYTSQMQFEIGDIDGDGYDDIVTSCEDSLLFVLRNISTPDSIAFAAPVRIPVMGKDLGEDLRLADLNGDGRLDIAVEGGHLFRNRSQPGNILFDMPYTVWPYGEYLKAIEDLDGDGLPELLSYFFTEQMFINRNLSNQSGFRFEVQTFPVSSFSLNKENYFLADMDNDGRSDLVFGHGLPGFSVVRNTSSPGQLSFGTRQSFYANEYWNGFPLEKGDVDGDGRLD